MVLRAATSLAELLAQDDAEHELLRQFVVPEEDKGQFATGVSSGYRWFKSRNIICLGQARRLREKAAAGGA
jgi:hypothetical protein